MIWFISGLFIGVAIGYLTAALMFTAAQNRGEE